MYPQLCPRELKEKDAKFKVSLAYPVSSRLD